MTMAYRRKISTGQHASPPTDERECLEAIWSVGRSCKSCGLTECYRHGWAKQRVDADNRRLVEEKTT